MYRGAILSSSQELARRAMTVYIFENRGIGARSLQQALGRAFADRVCDWAIWSFSTYYGTKSPDYKLTNKELLSIILPHIFVGCAPIFVKPSGSFRSENEIEKIDGLVGMFRGKPEREHFLRLARIVRRKRERVKAGENMLELTIYDCIADGEEAFDQCGDEIELCDKFFARYVTFSTAKASQRVSTQSESPSENILDSR
jgi:hypothetical protein